jgi:hypothetical protein
VQALEGVKQAMGKSKRSPEILLRQRGHTRLVDQCVCHSLARCLPFQERNSLILRTLKSFGLEHGIDLQVEGGLAVTDR